ncbi:MAG: MBL fold metallo-hydrolase [Promethearchaeota archaeon]
MARKIVKKIKEQGLYPIHKLLLSHSHFDHVQGTVKLKKLMKDVEIEVLASEKAIKNLKNPEIMNEYFGYKVDPIENVTPLKEGDIIDIDGLKLEVFDFFGHTQDSIALLDKKNKNIFVGDSIIDKYDPGTPFPEFVPPDFNESKYLKTFEKLRNLKDQLNSISLGHFGVWKNDDFYKIVDEMEEFHFNAKDSLIRWYNENPSLEYITLKYHEEFTPESKIHTKDNMLGLQFTIGWLIDGLKMYGFIK